MSDFIKFRTALQKNFDKLAKNGPLYFSDLSKDVVWDTYMNSYPPGTNEIFRERPEHDCVQCKQSLRLLARIIGEVDGKPVTIWNGINTGTHYDHVAKEMDALVSASKIAGVFLHDEKEIGRDHNFELLEDGTSIKWNHFHQVLPEHVYVRTGVSKIKGEIQTHASVLKRSLEEISYDAIDTVLELIGQDSLYRGTEHKRLVETIRDTKRKSEQAPHKELFYWKTAKELGAVSSMRNTVIGTLLVDISEGVELEKAVKSFETKVAPQNYKRSSSLVTNSMKEDAKKKVQELGIERSFKRRYANKRDVSVNNVLFVDGAVKPFMEDSIFDVINTAVPIKTSKVFDGVQEVLIDDFIKDILPGATQLEMMIEGRHRGNLMSLIAPEFNDAPRIMKWNNNFSWTYNGDITDSTISAQVKAAGGVIDAPFRGSLAWKNRDDLDLYLVRTHARIGRKEEVYFASRTGFNAQLDVDMRGHQPEQYEQVENIFSSGLPVGSYEFKVHNFCSNSTRTGDPVRVEGFEFEFVNNGETQILSYPNKIRGREYVQVLTFDVTANGSIVNIKIPTHIKKGNSIGSELWGVMTGQFTKVNMVMLSPNHWDNQEIGNKHHFFMIDGCKNPDSAVGFYNEFLIAELNPHRKVFEYLSSALRAPESDEQLSGFGFSSTIRNDVVVRVQKNNGTHVYKVKF